jgi:hypothetical protein
MAQREQTIPTSPDSWPNWRDSLHYRWGYLQGREDLRKEQQAGTSGDRWMKTVKAWVERYEFASKLWRMRRQISWTLLLAGWWDYALYLVRLLTW